MSNIQFGNLTVASSLNAADQMLVVQSGVTRRTTVQAVLTYIAASLPTSIADPGSNGLLARTSSGTSVPRTLSAGSSKVSIVNGSGVAGDPSFDIVEGSLDITNMTGTLPVARGGTGVTTLGAAITALLPTQTGQSGKVLSTNGAGTLSWIVNGAGGGGLTNAYTNLYDGTTTAGANGADTIRVRAASTKVIVVVGSNDATYGDNISFDVSEANLTLGNIGGTLGLSKGGTGATTQQGAANAVLPSQSTHSGQFLTTDGTNVSWAAGSGGVSSIFTRTGAVVAASGDYSSTQITGTAGRSNFSPLTGNVESNLVAIDTALGLKAPLASPTFTGTVTATGTVIVPTPSVGDNTQKAASTAYVQTAIAGLGGGGSKTPWDRTFGGIPQANDRLGFWVSEQSSTLTNGLSGSYFRAFTAPTAIVVVTIKKNGSSIGTLTWAAGSNTPTVSFVSSITFAAGDYGEVVMPGTADSTFADIDLVFVRT